jgi:hypothetical protein
MPLFIYIIWFLIQMAQGFILTAATFIENQ